MNGPPDHYGTLLDLVHRLEDASRAYGARPLDLATCERLRDEEQQAQTELLGWVQGRIAAPSDEGLRRAAETLAQRVAEAVAGGFVSARFVADDLGATAEALRSALSGAPEET